MRPFPTPSPPSPTESPVAAPQGAQEAPRVFAPPPQPLPEKIALAVVISAFSGLGYALSARAILLAVLIGGFSLGVLVMQQPSVIRLCALVAYGVLAILPCVWLEQNKAR